MKYMYNKFVDPISEKIETSICVKHDDGVMTSFPDQKGNPNYDQFLVDAQLTDAKVKKLTPDTWFDFPTPVEETPPTVEEATA